MSTDISKITIPNKRERNQKALTEAAWGSPEVKKLREGIKRQYGLDIRDAKTFPVMESNFSWTKLREKLSLREADSFSANTQFLVAGLQTIVNNMYAVDTTTTFEDWAHVVASKKNTEPYAPNQGVSFPRQVGPSEIYPEVATASLNLNIKNYKFGNIYSLEKELLDDDQSGTFQAQAGMMGQYMKLLQEVWCYGKLASLTTMQYVDLQVPKSETQPDYEANYPYTTSAAPFRGGGYNRPTSFGLPTRENIQSARTAMLSQKNLQGIKMAVNVNRLICGPSQSYDISIILNSAYYPSGAAAAGATGGAFAINPLKGIANLTVSPYVVKNAGGGVGTFNGDSTAWYYCDDTKPFFVNQIREAATVVQENPQAGMSFNQDIYRFKCTSRSNADFIDPRFIWQGNDGTVTS